MVKFDHVQLLRIKQFCIILDSTLHDKEKKTTFHMMTLPETGAMLPQFTESFRRKEMGRQRNGHMYGRYPKILDFIQLLLVKKKVVTLG